MMRILSFLLLSGCCLLAACAGSRPVSVSSADDYVEIDNPAVTMSSSAPAKIWVPRKYLESGVPRGGEMIKSGAEKFIELNGFFNEVKEGRKKQATGVVSVE